jgi:hypothetical protein
LEQLCPLHIEITAKNEKWNFSFSRPESMTLDPHLQADEIKDHVHSEILKKSG